MRRDIREIRILQRAGIPTASAELPLTRMRARVNELYRERETLRKADPSAPRRL
jgi:hypothetical protein